jgi:putative hemolysin
LKAGASGQTFDFFSAYDGVSLFGQHLERKNRTVTISLSTIPMSPVGELSIVLVLILINGWFVVSEMAIISARKVRLQHLVNQGNKRARIALELANNPSRFLPTVQVGITLMAILSGARGESAVGRLITPLLTSISVPNSYVEPIASVMAIAIVTYLTIVIGELVPKQLALSNPERLSVLVAKPLNLLGWLGSPLSHVLSKTTNFIVKLLGIRPSSDPEVTEEEIRVMIGQGTEAGMFEEAEQDMMERVMNLGDRRVGAMMTPRPDIVWLDIEDPWPINRDKIVTSQYSRFPICKEVLDNVVGVIHVADILSQSLVGQSINLTLSLIQPLLVPESTKGLKVLEQFKETGTHIGMVVDEYGVIQGLVTLNDLLEEIVGNIQDVEQPEPPQAVQREDGSWLLDGMLPIDEFLELFDLEEESIEQRGSYNTLGGFIIMQLGKIPQETDHFEWEQLEFEVMDMDGNRVDKVLVQDSRIEELQQQ